MIDGRVYIAEDTGGMIKGKSIDLYVGTEAASVEYGVRYLEVAIRGDQTE